MQRVGEPERAREEGALAARQTVHIVVVLRPVAQQETFVAQVVCTAAMVPVIRRSV
jgi:hypothetical protein